MTNPPTSSKAPAIIIILLGLTALAAFVIMNNQNGMSQGSAIIIQNNKPASSSSSSASASEKSKDSVQQQQEEETQKPARKEKRILDVVQSFVMPPPPPPQVGAASSPVIKQQEPVNAVAGLTPSEISVVKRIAKANALVPPECLSLHSRLIRTRHWDNLAPHLEILAKHTQPRCGRAWRDLAVLTFRHTRDLATKQKAIEWAQKAIDLGVVTAKTDKGVMMVYMSDQKFESEEAKKNFQNEALKLLHEAADVHEDPIAMESLGEVYSTGGFNHLNIAVPKPNFEYALKYYRGAASRRFAEDSPSLRTPSIRLLYVRYSGIDRNAIHLSFLPDTKQLQGFEIGPSIRPLCPKRGGHKTIIIDHDTAEGLKAKYRQPGHAIPHDWINGIEEVDVVYRGKRLKENVLEKTGGKKLHWGISSHVLEHIPNLVGFLNEVAEFMDEDAVFVNSVPDKRRTFDILRPVKTYEKMLADLEAKREEHGEEAVREYNRLFSRTDGNGITFDERYTGYHKLGHNEVQVEAAVQSMKRGEYQDIHNLATTPFAFLAVINRMITSGKLKWHISSFAPGGDTLPGSSQHEFLIGFGMSKSKVYDGVMNQETLDELAKYDAEEGHFLENKGILWENVLPFA